MKGKGVLLRFVALVMVLNVANVAFCETRPFQGKRTDVAFSPGFVAALESLGVQVAPVKSARIRAGQARFPIPAAEIDLNTASGEVWHTGGLALSAGNTRVELTLFIIDTTVSGAPVLTGLVKANETVVGRLPLFNLVLPALPLPLEVNRILTIPDVKLTLSEEAAGALNSVFNVTAFTEGFDIGVAHTILKVSKNL